MVWTGWVRCVAWGASIALPVACASPAPEPVVPTTGVAVGAGLVPDARTRGCLGDPSGYSRRDELEPHVAVNPGDPEHLVAAWMVRTRGTPGAIFAAASRTGGRTWGRPQALPFNECAGGPAGLTASSDPWVTIGPEGRAYVSAMGWTPGEDFDSASVLGVVTSSDGGDSWGGLAQVSASWTPAFMHDNTAILADPRAPGVAWVTTTHWSSRGRPAAIARTGDGGATWSPLRFVTEASFGPPHSAPQPVVTDDAVYVFYGHDADGSRISFVRSTGSGASWSEPAPVHVGLPIDGAVRFPGTAEEIQVAEDIMHPAVDPETGDLYVVFTSAGEADASRPVVRLTASRDGGMTWSRPVMVGEPGETTWRPTLAVSPGGPAVVTYFRAAPESGSAAPESGSAEPPLDSVAGLVVELRMRAFGWEEGGGLTARAAVGLDRFSWRPRANGTRFLGDYHGLVVAADTAVAVFARSTPDGARVVAIREALR